jgi:hypothetical protein
MATINAPATAPEKFQTRNAPSRETGGAKDDALPGRCEGAMRPRKKKPSGSLRRAWSAKEEGETAFAEIQI